MNMHQVRRKCKKRVVRREFRIAECRIQIPQKRDEE